MKKPNELNSKDLELIKYFKKHQKTILAVLLKTSASGQYKSAKKAYLEFPKEIK